MGCTTSKSANSAMVGKRSSQSLARQKSESKQAQSVAVVEPAQVKEDPITEASQRACFAAGCYWGTEHFFYHKFGKNSKNGAILRGEVGFMGPKSAPANPSYALVKSGKTEHIEVYEFEYTGGTLYFEDLCRFFFQFHDPTTTRRQGEDVGLQYSSVIFCYTNEQMEIAQGVKRELQDLLNDKELAGVYEGEEVVTQILMATKFYAAHLEHQEYLTKNPDGECNHRMRFKEWPGRVTSIERQLISEPIAVDNTTTAPSVYSMQTMPHFASMDATLAHTRSGEGSASMNQLPTSGASRVSFGAGCYWGTEKFLRHDFSKITHGRGAITQGQVGFMGPKEAPVNPTYRQVCAGNTGHVEVYDCEYTGGLPFFEEIVRFFFSFHDPTTKKRQGNDRGVQYSSVIYCYDQQQLDVAMKVRNELQQLMDAHKLVTGYENDRVVTDIRAATTFYPAHKEHQDYLELNPEGYCNHRIRFRQWPSFSEADDADVLQVNSVDIDMEEKADDVTAASIAVNSTAQSALEEAVGISGQLEPADDDQSIVGKACFGAGCYWGTEKYFYHNFRTQFIALGDITSAAVGFMGPEGAPADPTYKEVCSGSTGHVEVYQCDFTGGSAYYEAMVRFFFQFHDPTTVQRQGNDVGTQYASVIYCFDDRQMEIAKKVVDELQVLLDEGKITSYTGERVVTEIRSATVFYPAHSEHQNYLELNPGGYCNHRIRFKEWPVSSESSH